MRFIRKLFFFFLVSLTTWGGISAYNKLTDGFSLHQMTSSLPLCPQFEVFLDPEKKQDLQQMIAQPFRYISKGCQFYVFESQDSKYVLKFLKHKHLRPLTWLQSLPLPPKWRQLSLEKIERRNQRVETLFSSCKLAYEKMPEETGLLFIHLNRTEALEKKILLIDKLGLKHRIAIDDYEYVLQKKGLTLKETFTRHEPSVINAHVDQLADLVIARCRKGIRDRDKAFVQNVAILPEEGRAIFTDIGQFYEDPLILEKEEQERDLAHRLHELSSWTQWHFPLSLPASP